MGEEGGEGTEQDRGEEQQRSEVGRSIGQFGRRQV